MYGVANTTYKNVRHDVEMLAQDLCDGSTGDDNEESKEQTMRNCFSFLDGATDQFRLSFGTALQVAAWTTLLSAATLVAKRRNLSNAGFSMSTILCNMLFTVGSDLGSTINNFFYGIIGSLWAWFAFWLFLGVFPGGYTGNNDHVWWVGALYIAVYTLIFLIVNVNENIRFWALLNFTGGFAMDILNPNTTTEAYSTNFNLDYATKAENGLILFVLGAILAMLIFAFPYLSSLDKSQRRVSDVLSGLTDLQRRVLNYYAGAGRTLEVENLADDFVVLKSQLSDAEAHGANSWFESLGKSNRRALSGKLVKMMHDVMDCYHGIFPVIATEDFSESHYIMLRSIRQPLEQTMDCVHTIMGQMLMAAEDGILDDEERADMEERMMQLPILVQEIQSKVQEASSQFGRLPLNRTVLGEHAFAYTTCSMAQMVLDHARDLFEDPERDSWFGMWKEAVRKLFTITRSDCSWATRASIAIFLNFAIGYIGRCNAQAMDDWRTAMSNPEMAAKLVGKEAPSCLVEPYTVALANINIVLLSKLHGSTFKSGLDRLAAVVVAVVVGQGLYSFLGWCDVTSKILSAVAIFFVTWCFMYMGYRGGSFAALGQRLAAITVSSLMADCTNDAYTTGTYSKSYHSLVYIVVGVLIVMTCDMLLGSTSSATQCLELQLQTLDAFHDLCRRYLDGLVPADSMPAALADVAADLDRAKELAVDAAAEPNFWRAEWNAPLFTGINAEYASLCRRMRHLAEVVGDDKDLILDTLSSFQGAKHELLTSMGFTSEITKAALQNDSQSLQRLMKRQSKAFGLTCVDTMLAEMNSQGTDFWVREREDELHILASSRRCVIVIMLESISNVLNLIQARSVKKAS
eukprot:TRINITY_DN105803_c0_g1_i1.p1 TRINITY_DN105803_c0_g1~~TRINITY_DN105803_c0_g1_i1.p1  ORF type:complete len:859 (-),score=170.86 TRINITY_DN105803_c0_g1_i1:93-2669(-)